MREMVIGEALMEMRQGVVKNGRLILAVLLLAVGFSLTLAWGALARQAAPAPAAELPPVLALYAAWQPDGGEATSLFRSSDEGTTWVPLALPGGAAPMAWAGDGGRCLAVATVDGAVLRSGDQGDTWTFVAKGLPVTSLAWDDRGGLYLGTNGRGVRYLAADGTLVDVTPAHIELAAAQVVDLGVIEGQLFVATPTVLYSTFDGGATWTRTAPLPERVTAIAVFDPRTVYVGTATAGVYKSVDAGQSWRPAREGLGLAAGQMVRITALRADLSQPGLLYATVDHVVGGTQLYASAMGTFVTVDGGASWQPLAGPGFPEARHALGLVLLPGKPLYAQAITARGPQAYTPEVDGSLADLQSSDPQVRTSAARLLGLARPAGVWRALLSALGDSDPAVGLAAAEALGRIQDPASVAALLAAVEDPSEPVRLGAARALGLMGVEAAVEPLRSMLLHGGAAEPGVAGEALGRIGGPAATDALLAAVADPQPTARWHAAMSALERMGEPAVAPLVAMLNSADTQARRSAAQALGWIGSPSASEALARALRKDGDPAVRSGAAWALGEAGDHAARRALERAQVRDPSEEVRQAADWALSRVPEPSATSAGWTTRQAALLTQLQAMRWLVLALSLAGAALLLVEHGPKQPTKLRQRVRYR